MNCSLQYRGPLSPMTCFEHFRPRKRIEPHQNNLLLAALECAKHGWPVFPCEARGKRPLTSHGFKDATADQSRIRSYWTDSPNANIGVATGAASGIVVDIDPRNGGDEQLAALEAEHDPLPRDHVVATGGGGLHIYLRSPAPPIPNLRCCQLAPGIDIKADGGYVISPPSVHPSGQQYALIEKNVELSAVPDWLVAEHLAKNGAQAHAAEAPEISADDLRVSDEIKQLIRDGKPKGHRSEAIFAAMRAIVLAGHSDEEIFAVLTHPANRLSEKPLEKGRAWLQGEITRARAKLDKNAGNTATGNGADASGHSHAEGQAKAHTHDPNGAGLLVQYRRLSDVEARPIDWLWSNRIARGKLTVIGGDPGLGKSQLTNSITATTTTGGRRPVTGEKCDVGSVVILSAEDDAADTIRPRLEAAGADLQRCFIVEAVREQIGDGKSQLRTFNLKTDLVRLEAVLAEIGDVALIVIDPMTAYLGGIDSHKNAEVRSLLAPLAEMAARHRAAVVLVSHLSKAAQADAIQRVTGSIGFVAAARAVFLVAKDKECPARRLFLPVKNNIGKDHNGLAFTLESQQLSSGITTSRVVWEAESVTVTADEAISPADAIEERSATAEAMEWLKDLLAFGPKRAADIKREAGDAGIKEKPLRSAQIRLGIRRRKIDFNSGWEWSLPDHEDAHDPEDAQHEK